MSRRVRLKYFLAAVLLLTAVQTYAEDRRPDPEKLTLMSFNVEFMRDGIAPEEGSERITFEHRGNPALAAAKMAKIAKIIRKHDPDIVSLDEVENLDALELLNRDHLDGMRYKAYLKNGRDTFTGQDVGILTRIDLDEPLWREDRKGRNCSLVSVDECTVTLRGMFKSLPRWSDCR